jgi:GxxExxY protein
MTLMHQEITDAILGASIEVHSTLGPGLLESAYEACLFHELITRGRRVRRQVELPVTYKGVRLEAGYRIDLMVDEVVIVEVKSAEQLQPIFEAQLMTYLRLSGLRVGLLVNFGMRRLMDGFVRRAL